MLDLPTIANQCVVTLFSNCAKRATALRHTHLVCIAPPIHVIYAGPPEQVKSQRLHSFVQVCFVSCLCTLCVCFVVCVLCILCCVVCQEKYTQPLLNMYDAHTRPWYRV